MKRILLSFGLLLGLSFPALAQVPCIGVGGVNSVPQVGIACIQEPSVNSYAATSVALVPVAAGATDFFCIGGAAGKVIRIQQFRVSGTATTIVTVPLLVTKHVSLDTGTTGSTGTQIPVPYALDPTDAAPTATTRAWITTNPTITDAAPGIVDSSSLTLNLPAAVGSSVNLDYRARQYNEALTLRTAAQEVCLNLNTTAVVAGLLYITASWTEAGQ